MDRRVCCMLFGLWAHHGETDWIRQRHFNNLVWTVEASRVLVNSKLQVWSTKDSAKLVLFKDIIRNIQTHFGWNRFNCFPTWRRYGAACLRGSTWKVASLGEQSWGECAFVMPIYDPCFCIKIFYFIWYVDRFCDCASDMFLIHVWWFFVPEVDKKLLIILRDGRKLIGWLRTNTGQTAWHFSCLVELTLF